MSLANKAIVVTGGKGFLGRFVCRAIEEKGGKAIAIGSKDYNLIEQSEIERYLDPEYFESLLVEEE